VHEGAGFTSSFIEPDVSNAIMKYGLDGGGQSAGLGDAQSNAEAVLAAVSNAPNAEAESRAAALREKDAVMVSHLEGSAQRAFWTNQGPG
jgi:hypothetical protein